MIPDDLERRARLQDRRRLLEAEAWEAPRRLTPAEGRAATGPDWAWKPTQIDEQADD